MRSKTATSKEGEVNGMDLDGEGDDESEREVENDSGESELLSQLVTLGCMEMVDGRLLIETVDLEEVDAILVGLQEDLELTEDTN